MFDDDPPVRKNDAPQPRNMERDSIEEIGEYIDFLRGEIERAETEITRKEAQKNAAANIFGKS